MKSIKKHKLTLIILSLCIIIIILVNISKNKEYFTCNFINRLNHHNYLQSMAHTIGMVPMPTFSNNQIQSIRRILDILQNTNNTNIGRNKFWLTTANQRGYFLPNNPDSYDEKMIHINNQGQIENEDYTRNNNALWHLVTDTVYNTCDDYLVVSGWLVNNDKILYINNNDQPAWATNNSNNRSNNTKWNIHLSLNAQRGHIYFGNRNRTLRIYLGRVQIGGTIVPRGTVLTWNLIPQNPSLSTTTQPQTTTTTTQPQTTTTTTQPQTTTTTTRPQTTTTTTQSQTTTTSGQTTTTPGQTTTTSGQTTTTTQPQTTTSTTRSQIDQRDRSMYLNSLTWDGTTGQSSSQSLDGISNLNLSNNFTANNIRSIEEINQETIESDNLNSSSLYNNIDNNIDNKINNLENRLENIN